MPTSNQQLETETEDRKKNKKEISTRLSGSRSEARRQFPLGEACNSPQPCQCQSDSAGFRSDNGRLSAKLPPCKSVITGFSIYRSKAQTPVSSRRNEIKLDERISFSYISACECVPPSTTVEKRRLER